MERGEFRRCICREVKLYFDGHLNVFDLSLFLWILTD